MVGNFPLDPTSMPGGVEAVIRNLSVALARIEDLDVHILSCVPGLTQPEKKTYKGITLNYLPGQRILGNLTMHYQDTRRMIKALKELDPDIIHAHGTGCHVAAAQATDTPQVITVHGILYREVELYTGLKGVVRRFSALKIERDALKQAKHIFVIADYVKEAIEPFTQANLYSIANPVDDRFFAMETSDSSNRILSVATIQPRKGQLDLLEAFARIRPSVPDASLQFIGKVIEADYAEKLAQRVSELGLDECVKIAGFVTDQELEDAFTGCALFALCSAEESSPVSIAEAMTLGKPVVASAVGGIPDLIADNQTGYLTSYADIDSIAASLERILADKENRKRLGYAAKERALRDFQPAKAAQRTVEVYRKILTEKS